MDFTAANFDSIEVNGVALSANDYVAVGEVIEIDLDTSKATGIVADYDGTTYVGDNDAESGEYKVTEKDVTLKGAFQINLVGIASIETTSGIEIADGNFVTRDATIDISKAEDATGKAVTYVLDTSDGSVFDTSAASNVSVGSANGDITLSAATKVTVTGSATVTMDSGAEPIEVRTNPGDVYVAVGTELVANKATKVSSADGAMNITPVNGVAEFTVGNSDITVAG